MGATSDAFVFRYPKCIGFIVVGVHLKVCRFLSMGCVGLFELITYERMPKGGIFLGHSRSVALPFVGGLPPAVLSRTFTVVYCNFAPAFTAKLQLHHCLQLTPATGGDKAEQTKTRQQHRVCLWLGTVLLSS